MPLTTLAPLRALRSHPFPIEAFFEHVLVLTYAFPQAVLAPLLPRGLRLDTWRGQGFLAIALVQTRGLRPAGLPACLGQDFFLSGYRIFARLTTPTGRELRGLRILRSDTDRRRMVYAGNLFTDYHYRQAHVALRRTSSTLEVQLRTRHGQADLHVMADLSSTPTCPPAGSPFRTLAEARRFAGPLPLTFADAPRPTSALLVKGVRANWHPRLVDVRVEQAAFLEQPALRGATPVLASAFYIAGVPYRWERGVVQPVGAPGATAA